MLGFGRKKPKKPEPELGPDGRPKVERWSPEHLARLCDENPSFQIMTVDGLHWIDPFTKHLIPATFDWQEAAISWMAQNAPWRKQPKPLSPEILKQVRWAHYLHHNFEERPELKYVLPNGRWLNPLNGQWVRIGKLEHNRLPKEARGLMAVAMATAEDEGAGSQLLNDFELKRSYDIGLQKLQEAKLSRSSASLNPPVRTSPPIEEQGNLSIGNVSQGRLKSSRSAESQNIPSLELPPEPPQEPGFPSHILREAHAAGYTVGECLGRGGMAAVYKANQRNLDRDVALKIRVPEHEGFSIFVERFLSEARTAAKINSPHVVTIFDVGSTASMVYMALQYYEGGDLLQQLKRVGAFSPEEGLRCASDILKGLAAIHDLGFIHRDVKTANCFIDNEGHIALGDLGIVLDLDDDRHITKPDAIIGTPAFMSPEQTIPGATLDFRSDIYAVGVIAFHIISGQLPYDGENSMVILRKLIAEPTPDLREVCPQVDPRIADFIFRLMSKEPDERPASAYAAVDEIESILRG